jgi:hypothetical protein
MLCFLAESLALPVWAIKADAPCGWHEFKDNFLLVRLICYVAPLSTSSSNESKVLLRLGSQHAKSKRATIHYATL